MKINKIIISIILIVLLIILGAKNTYALTKKNGRIEGYNELVTSDNVGKLIVLATWADLFDNTQKSRIENLIGSYGNQIGSAVLNMGYPEHHTYCVQHMAKNVLSDMMVKHYIRIRGNKILEHKYAVKENNSWVTKGGYNNYTDSTNAVLAYILACEKDSGGCAWSKWDKSAVQTGSEGENKRQLALKKYWNTWLSTAAKKKIISEANWIFNEQINDEIAQKAIDDAEKNYLKSGVPSISATERKVKGPNPALKLTYSGKISSIEVKATDNTTIASSNIEYYTDKAYTKKINMNQIPNDGKSFYIKNKSNKTIKSVNIKVEDSTYQVELWFLESTGYLGKESIVEGNKESVCQKLITVKDDYLTTTDDVTINYINETPTTGNIKIVKKDSVSGKTIAEVTKFKIKNSKKGWLNESKGSYVYKEKESDGKEYLTTNGVLELKGLEYGTYTIKEVLPPKGYILDVQPTNSINVNLNNRNITSDFTNVKKGSLTIYKKDEQSNKELTGAGFKIKEVTKNKWLKINSSGKYGYVSGYADADLFEMKNLSASESYKNKLVKYPVTNNKYGTKGLCLDGLDDGVYHIYEFKTPSGYIFSQQNGYAKTSKGDEYVDTGREITINSNSSKYISIVTIKNLKKELDDKKISIEGYVWVDEPPNKNSSTYNSTYDSREAKLRGVSVRLMKKGTTPTQVGATTTTDENGKYSFDSLIKLSELENYYVEFDYSKLDNLKTTYKDAEGKEHKYINYIPVAFKPTSTNGSKAMMKNVATKDIDLSGIATTYTGANTKTNEVAIKNYGLTKCGTMNNSTLTLSNINLGIKKIPVANYNLTENLAYVKIVMKGNTYTYTYGGTENKSYTSAPKVYWQDKGDIHGYSAEVYPSDISYNIKNSKEELKIYVVYRIDVTNLTNTNIAELYVEDKLQINSLENYYDKDRYILEKSYDLNESDNVKKDFNNWSNPADAKKNGKNVKVVKYNLEKFAGGIPKDKTQTSYIEFRVQEKAIDKILDKLNNPNGIIEDFPTEVVTNGYHNYKRDDYSWDNLAKGNILQKGQNHRTIDDLKDDTAPYLIFKLGKERTIQGKVFKDTIVTNNGEKLGNGIDDNEKGVEDVVVELVDVDSNNGTEITNIINLPTSNLYPEDKTTEADKANWAVKSSVRTNSSGEYTLKGVVPGYYYLRFIYGDGEYKITDLTGNVIESGTIGSKIGDTKIEAKKYKSTIVNKEKAQVAINALKGGTDLLWYQKLNSDKASVALDKLETRKAVNDNQLQNIIAGTAKLFITIENDKDGYSSKVDQNAKYDANNNEITQNKNDLHSQVATAFNGLNFGIIEVPEQDAEIQKLITNVKLTNTQGNVLYNGNPETIASQGVVALSDLDNTQNGGSTYVRAEMQEESLYGTNLELTYEVKVTNKSDINYYTNEYYWYGETNNSANKEVTLTPTDVKDYLDETLIYVEEKSDKDRITSNGTKNIKIENGKSVKAEELDLKGKEEGGKWTPLYTNKITNRDDNYPTSDKVKIVAQKLLSNQDDDMEVVSRAEIKGIERTPDPNDKTATEAEKTEQIRIAPKEVHTNGMVKATFTITPPTGENRSTTTIYVVAGIMSLIILSTGIVIIKKKVI